MRSGAGLEAARARAPRAVTPFGDAIVARSRFAQHTEPRVNVDWRRLKAVVLESDDWGLCAWVPDDAAHRALANLPAFRGAAGRRYGRSTLESADDVHALVARLLTHRGADGL